MSPLLTSLASALLAVCVGARCRPRPRPRPVGASSADRGLHAARFGAISRPAGRPTHRRRRCPVASPEHVAAWCDALARAAGSGSTLSAALREVDPPASCTDEVTAIRLALRRGAAVHDACSLATPSAHLELALTVIRACAGHGGDPSEPLGRTAAVLRGRAADAADLRVQSAQARLSAIVMTALPLGVLLLLCATSGSVRRFVLSPVGCGLVFVGLALNLTGWRWMARLIGGPR